MVKMLTPPAPQQFDELIQKFAQVSKNYVSKSGQRLAKLPDELIRKLRTELGDKGNYLNQAIEKVQQKVIQQCTEIVHGPHVRIEVRSADISTAKRSSRLRPQLIPGKVFCKRPGRPFEIEVDCFVACGSWDNLGELKEHKINLVEHLVKLLPKNREQGRRPLGLVTFQNGIKNTLEDFTVMSQLIIEQLTEGSLCIGLHNPTSNNFLVDMTRFRNEPELNERAVYSFCQMVKTFADLIPTVNPDLVWLHLAHSEGGLIANAVLELCKQWWLKNIGTFIKKHLVTATYGAVKPIPDDYVLAAINTYSTKDIALFYGRKYLDKNLMEIDKKLSESTEKSYTSRKVHEGLTYTVTVVKSELEESGLILKMQLQEPKILTLEERLQISWFESLAHIHDLDGSPQIADAMNTKLLDTVHSIKDHGFKEVTYQNTFKDNIDELRKDYKFYDAKKNR